MSLAARITERDYLAVKAHKTTIADLCYLRDVSYTTASRELAKYRGTTPRRRLTDEQRELLKTEIINAVPYDKKFGITAVLKLWGIPSITHALMLLKVRNLSELRYNSDRLGTILQKLNLKLDKNVLYSPKHRGRYDADKQLVLTAIDLTDLEADPVHWLKANVERIKAVCLKN